jgi:hypothetical protein
MIINYTRWLKKERFGFGQSWNDTCTRVEFRLLQPWRRSTACYGVQHNFYPGLT